VQNASAPVVARGQRHVDGTLAVGFPIAEFVHAPKTEVVNEVSALEGNDDRLICRHFPERAAIEMVEVRMGHRDEIYVGQVPDLQPGSLKSFDDFQPVGPVRIDENILAAKLQEERRVANPRHSDIAVVQDRKKRAPLASDANLEQGGEPDTCDEIPFAPVSPRFQTDFMRAGFRVVANPVGGLLNIR